MPHQYEFASLGLDDFLSVHGADSFGTPYSAGLLVPQSLTGGVPYMFMGQSLDLVEGDAIVGMRELVTVASVYALGGGTTWPIERVVSTPGWHLPNAWVAFSLMSEPTSVRAPIAGPRDGPSCAFDDSAGPSFLYRSFAFPGGAPYGARAGYLGLDGTTYVPPHMRGTAEVVVRNVQDPWDSPNWGQLEIPVSRPTRFRAYIHVLQTLSTPPTLPLVLPTDARLQSLSPEDLFWQLTGGTSTTTSYWRVGVALQVRRQTERPS